MLNLTLECILYIALLLWVIEINNPSSNANYGTKRRKFLEAQEELPVKWPVTTHKNMLIPRLNQLKTTSPSRDQKATSFGYFIISERPSVTASRPSTKKGISWNWVFISPWMCRRIHSQIELLPQVLPRPILWPDVPHSHIVQCYVDCSPCPGIHLHPKYQYVRQTQQCWGGLHVWNNYGVFCSLSILVSVGEVRNWNDCCSPHPQSWYKQTLVLTSITIFGVTFHWYGVTCEIINQFIL